MLVPSGLERLVVFRSILDGVLNLAGNANDAFEPIDQNHQIVEMLRLRHLLICSSLTNIFAGFGAIYLYARRRAGALTDQFAAEVEVGNASSLNAEIFHISYCAISANRGACSRAAEPVCRRYFLFITGLFFEDLAQAFSGIFPNRFQFGVRPIARGYMVAVFFAKRLD